MHVGSLAGSPAMQRVLALLRQRGVEGATTQTINDDAHVTAASTWISGLRGLGFGIIRKYEPGHGPARVHRYWLCEEKTT